MNKKTIAALESLDACGDAMAWLKKQKTPTQAWKSCRRGDWMLWLCGKLSGAPGSDARRKLVLCACECARLSLPIFEKRYPDDMRPRKAIETAEAWARGVDGAGLDDVRSDAAAYAAAAAYADAAAYAAYAADAAYAAYAADAAYAAAYAAADAAYAAAADAAYAAAADAAAYAAAADAYAAAADAAAADAARDKTLSQCADIVRKYYPKCPKPPPKEK